MNAPSPEIPARRSPRGTTIAPITTILLAIAFGLCAGYLDVGMVFVRRYLWHSEGHFRTARDFPWTIPLGHTILMVAAGMLVLVVSRSRPKRMSLRAQSWIFATLAVWSVLLRTPMQAGCGLLLAAGIGRVAGDLLAAHAIPLRQTRMIFLSLLGGVIVLAGMTSGWQAIREHITVARLSPAPSGARNVVLVVWDTVSANNLGLHGYPRETTPNLARWAARRGVVYGHTISSAPWTFPSHTCFFTGHWPFRLNSQCQLNLDSTYPTLAGHLSSLGYQTAGFSANTNWCSYETGLDRGFAHFDDYSLTPTSLLSRTIPGMWVLKNVLYLSSFCGTGWIHNTKWIDLQSRDASDLNDAFGNWLNRRRQDRPFFAFLNYFDAHEPYLPPPGHRGRFGIGPETPWDFQFLVDFNKIDKNEASSMNLTMARDSYDDCIAYLDDQLGRLLDDLQRRGLLDNTDVIITSDHGEGFGVHHYFGHDNTANLEEIGVPLVILSPAAPAGHMVNTAVSLRDLPATVVDLLGLSANSPFPGHSLAAYWKRPSGTATAGLTSPAFSEKLNGPMFEVYSRDGQKHPGFQMSLVAGTHHYIRDSLGDEQLYDLRSDPLEQGNLAGLAAGNRELVLFRKMLLGVLVDNPGSTEVEKAYLATFRRWLGDVVEANSPQRLAAGDGSAVLRALQH